MMRVLVKDALAQMKATGWAPIAFPAFKDARGAGVIKKNLDGIHVTHQNGADGWIEELSYWYWAGKMAACKACGGPSGQVRVIVAPVTAVQILTREQSVKIARAWNLDRGPRQGRIVKYPYGREIRRSAELGSLHPRCLVDILSRRGWILNGSAGSDADPRMPSVAWSSQRDETGQLDVRNVGRSETQDEKRARLLNGARTRNAQRLAEYRMWQNGRGSYAYRV